MAQLPDAYRTRHDQGDKPATMERKLLVRSDGAGASHWLAEVCIDRNIEFSLGYAIDESVRD